MQPLLILSILTSVTTMGDKFNEKNTRSSSRGGVLNSFLINQSMTINIHLSEQFQEYFSLAAFKCLNLVPGSLVFLSDKCNVIMKVSMSCAFLQEAPA